MVAEHIDIRTDDGFLIGEITDAVWQAIDGEARSLVITGFVGDESCRFEATIPVAWRIAAP